MTKEEYINNRIYEKDIWFYNRIKNHIIKIKNGDHGYNTYDNDFQIFLPIDKKGDQEVIHPQLNDIFLTREAARQEKRETFNLICTHKDDDWKDIASWFSLSRASWAVLPRVMMEAMPEDWQREMGKLLFELDEAFPNFPTDFEYSVNLRNHNTGRYLRTPDFLVNYRHPSQEFINFCKPPYKQEKEISI